MSDTFAIRVALAASPDIVRLWHKGNLRDQRETRAMDKKKYKRRYRLERASSRAFEKGDKLFKERYKAISLHDAIGLYDTEWREKHEIKM